MPWQTIEINSTQVKFDRERTKEHRTDFNKPCECLECRNYYKHIENNIELVEFLSDFGVDYNCTEEVLSWELENNRKSLIHHEAYYAIYGKFEGEEFCFENFGVKIAFLKKETFPHDREGECFWICIEGDFPYILEGKKGKSIFSSITFTISVLVFLAMGLLTLDMINHNNSLQDIGDLDLFVRVMLYQASYFVVSIPGIVSSAVCFKISMSKGIKIISGVLLTIFLIVFLTFGMILFLGR